MTKHEQIIAYIESLKIGQKISVRKIAKVMNVSEGTAYRAIKDAGQLGLVTTIDRVGTVRIDKKNREEIENLTFNEILKIIDGEVIGGKNGLSKSVSKFAIGAMELKDVVKYISHQTLLIVGNRPDVQLEALKKGSGVLITGGFKTSQKIIDYANSHNLPILSSNYDTFLVANIINRAMYNQMIRKEILIVNDIVKPINDMTVVFDEMGLEDYKARAKVTGHSRFPVVDKNWKLVGIITSKETIHMQVGDTVSKVMTKRPINVELTTTVASCAHLMIWEGIEILPVTTKNRKAIGVITRDDVLKAMQLLGRQPQIGETINDQIAKHITITQNDITVEISPLLTNQYGTLSKSVFVAIIEETIKHELRKFKKVDVMIESLNIIYIKTVPIETFINVSYNMLDVGRNFAKLEVAMMSGNERVANAMIIVQMFEDF
ncbi:DRTGG domain-containing protein [Staphylococcus sp. NRL 16/872]|uniref:DRTGG domain-containing protein n=1 Tax=Staphylococcus sp. NRL 16/872 TaxID=2930131 RepID=UPI001FB44BE0|nr:MULTISPECIES: DRTGG domain-containing protein [unclassified Staphylococcus]MCJ1656147.1 DRTGG domain-containing protein [Staphylococcus sp. NRL 21/187]MCJ1667964.1 DRTGG domain-containing protein [Staphylococcus sp. NRL 19/737]WEN70452.1 DRTGG domain-containing protein [Staphylococcus sp. NRL 16/872]